MMLQSVFAAVDGGDHHADHLTLHARQRGFAEHQRLVEMEVIDTSEAGFRLWIFMM